MQLRRGDWQLGEEGCLDDLVLISTLACPMGSSAPGVLSRAQDGQEGGTICVARQTWGKRHSKEFLPVFTGDLRALQGIVKGKNRFAHTYK